MHSPLDLFTEGHKSKAPKTTDDAGLGAGTMSADERWAATALQLDGEEVIGRCNCMQHLLLAEMLLLTPLVGPSTNDSASSRRGDPDLQDAPGGSEGTGASEEMQRAAQPQPPLLRPAFLLAVSRCVR